MIAYLDTSDLIKLYVEEPGADAVRALAREADVVATSVVAYAETRSAVARLRRERRITARQAGAIVGQLDVDWPRFFVIDLTPDLALSAGRLADAHGIRGFDAVHLAALEALLSRAGDDEVRFSAADARLVRAARRLG